MERNLEQQVEQLLTVISKLLNVWTIKKVIVKKGKEKYVLEGIDNEDASQDLRELFKKELEAHLKNQLREKEVGSFVTYQFDCDNEANDSLKEVLKKLPDLPKGKYYALAMDLHIIFILVAKDKNKYYLEVKSPNIEE